MRFSPRPRRVVLRCLGVVGCLAVGAFGACDSARSGSSAEFCEAVDEHQGELFTWNWATLDDVEDLLDTVRDIGGSAPLAVETDWAAYELLLETALSSDDTQEILARAYATERSTLRIANWVGEHCGVAVTVATLVAHNDLTAPGVPAPADAPPADDGDTPPITSPP